MSSFSDSLYVPRTGDAALAVPRGYVLGERGTYAWKKSGRGKDADLVLEKMAEGPLWIEGTSSEIDSNQASVCLCTLVGKSVHRREVGRDVIADARHLVGLSRFSFPVNSNNARQAVGYLAAAEASNRDVLPSTRTVRRNGWRDGPDAPREFVLGTRLIKPEGDEILSPDPCAGIDPKWYDHYGVGGEEERWPLLVNDICAYPPVLVGVMASLASPLLHPLRENGFAIEFYDVTSVGKTTAVLLAMSAWGPGVDDLVVSADTTAVGAELRANYLQHLMCVLDDQKQFNGRKDELRRLVYMLAAGNGKTRGNQALGVEEERRWKLITVITGEQSVKNCTEDTGIHPRVLSFGGMPFGEKSDSMSAEVKRLRAVAQRHYGYAGLRMIQRLVQLDEEKWDRLRQMHDERKSVLEMRGTEAGGSPNLVSRCAGSFATLYVAAHLLAALYDVIRIEELEKSLDAAWMTVVRETSDVDYADASMEVVRNWIGTSAAAADRCREMDDGGTAVSTRTLHELLKEAEFDYKVALRAWEERRWVVASNKAVRMGSGRKKVSVKCCHLASAALDGGESTSEGESAFYDDEAFQSSVIDDIFG